MGQTRCDARSCGIWELGTPTFSVLFLPFFCEFEITRPFYTEGLPFTRCPPVAVGSRPRTVAARLWAARPAKSARRSSRPKDARTGQLPGLAHPPRREYTDAGPGPGPGSSAPGCCPSPEPARPPEARGPGPTRPDPTAAPHRAAGCSQPRPPDSASPRRALGRVRLRRAASR